MTVKIKSKRKTYYDWSDIVAEVEKLAGKSIRDWSGKYANLPSEADYKTGNFPAAIWAKSQGYDWQVLIDNPDGSNRTKEEIRLRIKINKKYDKVKKTIPYQDFWHYCLEHVFFNVSNDSFHYFNPSEHLEEIKDEDLKENNYVKEILPYFIQVFKESKIPDEIEVHVSW